MTSATLDPVFDALASDHRRRIVHQLANGPLDTPTLGATYDLSKQALNRHLVVLTDAGLVQRELTGRVHRLTLVTDPLDGVTDWISTVRNGWQANLDRLGIILGEDQA